MAVALLGALYLRQRLGGYTGDCLGAVQQVAELAFLVVALAASLS
jgi:adenosylcobinamide-GDP ribazoletransferase